LGQAGERGIFRDSKGLVSRIYVTDFGFATNNEAKITAVKQGILIVVREQYQRTIVEGDSAMVTSVL